MSTVQQAYHQLEMEGLIDGRPKSGYFVAYITSSLVFPVTSRPVQCPIDASQWQDVLEILLVKENVSTVQLQHAMPNMDMPSLNSLLKKCHR
jgi:DNA-binding transcriptional MocR family regulator